MKEFWNKRYSDSDYAYGKEPNRFFKAELDRLSPGSLFMPGEGEGRNAVYAATRGWDVHAIDISEKGREKALSLAKEYNTTIRYTLGSVETAAVPRESFDAAALIFVHLPPELFTVAIKKIAAGLKPGGKLIFELYSTKQLGRRSGGPKSIDMLFEMDPFSSMLIKLGLHLPDIREEEVLLSEGKHHSGKAMVIRGVAQKQQPDSS